MEEQSVSTSAGAKRSAEQSTSTSTGTKRSKKCPSLVWDQFEKVIIDEKLKAKCKDCGQIYACEHGTSKMLRYVSLKHGKELLDDELERVPLDQNHDHELMAKAIIKHNYSFSFVEHEGIREVHRYLNPEVQFITRNTAKADVLSINKKEKEKLKYALESVPGRIGLTSDLWSSITLDGYLSLTAHYVDENWILKARILNLRFLAPPHSGPLLAEKVIGLLREWGIERKVLTITLDNASANNGLVDVVKSHLNLTGTLLCQGEFFHVRCGAHILNLIVQSGLKVIEKCVNKIRENVKYVKGTKGRLIKFAQCVAQLSLKCNKKLRQDVPTRWNSTYLMLDSALTYKLAFYQLQLFDSNFKDCTTDEEWKMVEKIAKFLKPFHDITTLFS